MERIAMASSTTTGRFSMVPNPSMATLGWLITGKPNNPPKTPGLVMEKVLSATSSGLSFFARARSARSFMARAIPRKFFSSAFLITGTIRPQSSATAIPILHSWCNTMFVPSTEAFTVGNARSPSTAARTKKGMKVSLVPEASSNFAFIFARTAAMPETFTSSTEYTCGETCFESTMCSAIRWRITDMG